VVADELAARADVREQLQAVADLGAVAGDRRHGLDVGQLEELALDVLVDRRGQQRQRLVGGLLGREGRIARIRAQDGVHPPDHRAEVAQAGHEALGIAAELLERELPAVARVGDEALRDAERRVHQLTLVLVPAAERGDVGEALGIEEAQHLELGVVARLDAAEGLEHDCVVEDDRRVGLLRPDAAHGRAGARRLDPLQPVELDAGTLAMDLGAVAQQRAETVACLGVGERVVDGDAADLADDRLAEAVRPQAEHELVDVVRAAREARLHEGRRQRGRPAGDRHDVEHVELGDVASLGAEPPPVEQPLGQRCLVQGGEVNACHQ
jgi:hypothetical protein